MMRIVQSSFQKSIAICLIIVWAHAATAEFIVEKDAPYDYYSTHSSIILRPWFAQFESWYPHNAKYLVNISTGTCNQTLRDYRIEFAAPRNSVNATKLLSTCYRHEACIVDQLQTNHLLNYQSALVTLGLVPTLLVFVGPSVAELSLLYLHRPILSALLSLGTSAIWTGSNLFEANSPDRIRMTTMDALLPRHRLSPRIAWAVSAVEYLMAAGAAANAIFTAIEIGRKTILAWGCTTQFAPFAWAVSPSLVFAIAGAKNYYLVTKAKETTEEMRGISLYHNGDTNNDSNSSSNTLNRRKNPPRGLFNAILHYISRETTVCANRSTTKNNRNNNPGTQQLNVFTNTNTTTTTTTTTPKLKTKARIISNLIDLAIAIVGVLHFAFGVAAFSSLQFVTVMDAFGRILFRFALSSLLCRVVVVVELAGLGLGVGGGVGAEGEAGIGVGVGVRVDERREISESNQLYQ